MTLRVTQQDLDDFGHMVARAAEDSTAAKRYLAQQAEIGTTSQGVFLSVFQAHDDLLPKVESLFQKLHRVLEGSSEELGRVATYYRETDFRQAERFDTTLPHTKRP